MSQILSSHCSLLSFYGRRLRRILPSYLLVVFATLSVGQSVLIDSDFRSLSIDALRALSFSSNMEFKGRSYFEEINGPNLLLHSWSLSVELQFYLVAPLLLQFKSYWWVFLPLLGMASRLLQLFSSHSAGFSLMPARLWQFSMGVGAHRWMINHQPSAPCALYAVVPKWVLSHLVVLVAASTLLLPLPNIPLPALFQFICTVATSILLQCDQLPWTL